MQITFIDAKTSIDPKDLAQAVRMIVVPASSATRCDMLKDVIAALVPSAIVAKEPPAYLSEDDVKATRDLLATFPSGNAAQVDTLQAVLGRLFGAEGHQFVLTNGRVVSDTEAERAGAVTVTALAALANPSS